MRIDPYGPAAVVYDRASGEALVYRAGRLVGLRLLAPRPGDLVIDLGCGTGLNLPLLLNAVGPTGLVLGIDASEHMLDGARRRVRRSGWTDRVRLLHADAGRLEVDRVERLLRHARGRSAADAVVATYALSVMPTWEEAWRRTVGVLRPGGRAAVVDMQRPTGRHRLLEPLAVAACALGGADIDAHPWTMLERSARDVRAAEVRGGHIRAVAGVPIAP